jgi:GNAT superfamily N-acetyltransferase
MPDPLPVVVLGRLAIARAEQGRGLGHALLRDASLRVLQAAERFGVALLVVHALSERAKRGHFCVTLCQEVLRLAGFVDLRICI